MQWWPACVIFLVSCFKLQVFLDQAEYAEEHLGCKALCVLTNLL
jgi:hypothetical protein